MRAPRPRTGRHRIQARAGPARLHSPGSCPNRQARRTQEPGARSGVCKGTRRAQHQHQPREDIIAHTNRINDQIRFSPVRVIGPDGEQLGILPIEAARERAREHGLDLVEVAPTARPPVCRIMDWGKHQYQQQKAAREARKRQHTVEVKELKLRPGTDVHDLDVKLRHARRFLEKGQKVKVTVRYRGRELRRPEQGFDLLDRITVELDDLASVESRSGDINARQLTMMLTPD
ncbi:MAG TPA: translation initiation factor IF-3 [Longimicrobiaceae bacterium]